MKINKKIIGLFCIIIFILFTNYVLYGGIGMRKATEKEVDLKLDLKLYTGVTLPELIPSIKKLQEYNIELGDKKYPQKLTEAGSDSMKYIFGSVKHSFNGRISIIFDIYSPNNPYLKIENIHIDGLAPSIGDDKTFFLLYAGDASMDTPIESADLKYKVKEIYVYDWAK
ncbi:MAG: hypothetical protein AB1755_06650 [Candidatus Omnitrophota bacterium]